MTWSTIKSGGQGCPLNCISEVGLPRVSGEEKGNIGAIRHHWLLKRDYLVACRSVMRSQSEDQRVRESGPGRAEPGIQLPGQIGIQRYQMQQMVVSAGCLPSSQAVNTGGSGFRLPYVAALN